MARGLPAFWSIMVGLPIIGIGLYVYLVDTGYSPLLGVPFIVFGVFIILFGFYIQQLAAPEEPAMREGGELLEIRHPTQRVAFVYLLIGVPTLVFAAYPFYETPYPFVSPTLAPALALYTLSAGLQT